MLAALELDVAFVIVDISSKQRDSEIRRLRVKRNFCACTLTVLVLLSGYTCTCMEHVRLFGTGVQKSLLFRWC